MPSSIIVLMQGCQSELANRYGKGTKPLHDEYLNQVADGFFRLPTAAELLSRATPPSNAAEQRQRATPPSNASERSNAANAGVPRVPGDDDRDVSERIVESRRSRLRGRRRPRTGGEQHRRPPPQPAPTERSQQPPRTEETPLQRHTPPLQK